MHASVDGIRIGVFDINSPVTKKDSIAKTTIYVIPEINPHKYFLFFLIFPEMNPESILTKA